MEAESLSERERPRSGLTVPFHRPSISEEDAAEGGGPLRSGRATASREVRPVARGSAQALRPRRAREVSCPTAALYPPREPVGAKARDEVVIPGCAFPATGAVVTYRGARP